MAMEGRTLRKEKILRREWKTARDRSTSGLGSEKCVDSACVLLHYCELPHR